MADVADGRVEVSPATEDERRTIAVRRPASGELIGEVEIVTPEAVFETVERVRTVQVGWASFTVSDRLRRMRGLRRLVGERADEIAEVISAETGKPAVEAMAEVLVVSDLLAYYQSEAAVLLSPRRVGTGWLLGRRAYTAWEPYGVIGVISPWNYPFILSMNPVVTALCAGNGAVVKPSEYTPFTGMLTEQLVTASGLPEGLVKVVVGDGRTGEALVRSGVDKIYLTGSPGTARRVLAAAAERLTPVALELGGKDAAIVLEDADLDRAARGVLFGAFFNAGQTCISCERAYVVDKVFDPFVRRVQALAQELRAGTGTDVDVGPITTADQLAVIEDHVADAMAKGAKALVGGGRTDPASNVFQPTVLVKVDDSMKIMREETFGPVLPIAQVRDAEEAVARVNAHPYGLFASIWTGDVRRGEAMAARLNTGGVSINDVLSHYTVPGLAMGGVGLSGAGRAHGPEGLYEMSRTRSVLIDRLGLRTELWWFPYTERSVRLVRALVAFRAKGGIRGILAAVRRFLRRSS